MPLNKKKIKKIIKKYRKDFDEMELSEETKRELEERKKNPEFISHEEVKKRLRL